MTMQSDIKQFPQPVSGQVASIFVPDTVGWIPWGIYTGSGNTFSSLPNQLGRCRIRGLTIQFGTADDGFDYGQQLGIGNGPSWAATGATQPTETVFNIYIPSSPYTGYTKTFIFPGEGILIKDYAWMYLDYYNFYYYDNIYLLYS